MALFRPIIFALLAVAANGALLTASDPDFTGTWKLNADRSELHWQPRAPAHRLTIKQIAAGDKYSIEIREDDAVAALHASIDGASKRDRFEATTMSTQAKWEGDAFLINTIVDDPKRSYTRMDRWTLSRDRRTLSVTRSIIDRKGEVESLLVYERE
jgi:hypothetical protein